MRYALLIIALILSSSAFADNHHRNVAGKLTEFKKPQVKVMNDNERIAASQNTVALDLDADPNEIVCRKVRVGVDSASRLKVNRCKTRAEFREEAERNLALTGRELEEFARRNAVAQSAGGRLIQRTENVNRVRIRRTGNN